jgi:hypothetical protein
MSDVTTTPAGSAIDIDIDKPTQPPAGGGNEASNAFLEKMPEEYRSKEWLMNVAKTADPVVELAKMYDNQLSLLGRKAEGLKVPGEGATEEDWKNFNKALGVPETADKYEYSAPEVPEHLKDYFAADEKLLGAMKEACLKAGVRPEGFKELAKAFDSYYLSALDEQMKGLNDSLNKLETNFKAKFGDRSNAVLENWQKSLGSVVGEEQAAVIANLDPAVKVVLAEHFEGFAKKYIREDNLDVSVPTTGGALTPTAYADEFGQAFAALRQHPPGSAEHVAAQSRLNALREKGKAVFQK